MTTESLRDQSLAAAAAQCCGASYDVWTAVHDLHIDRKRAVVSAEYTQAVGDIVGISDEGFSLGSGISFTWPQVKSVRAQ